MGTELKDDSIAGARAGNLADRLRERIRARGPMSFRDWMRAALYDGRGGYYARRDLERWGREGDYRTSPERSPLFGAAFAEYFSRLHRELGAPREWTILEAGAGAGHFAQGFLETLATQQPEAFRATRYVIDEGSADARSRIAKLLGAYTAQVEFRALAEIQMPLTGIIFSNELLDALPTHRVVMRKGVLRELCVGVNDDDEFVWVETEPTTPALGSYFEWCGVELAEGQVAEACLDAVEWIKRAADSLRAGYVVTVDYGAEADDLYAAGHRRQGTLRGFRRHGFVENVLGNPGEQDITSTVNWTAIMKAGDEAGLKTLSLQRLDKFLMEAGLPQILERRVAASRSQADAIQLSTGAREMILPDGMAASFQVLIQKKGGKGQIT